MSVSGLCEVCSQADVNHTCDRCGKLVCDEHFDDQLGFCVECAVEVRRARGGGTGGTDRSEDYPDGVGEYRF